MENTLKQKLAAGAQPIGTFFDTASVSLMECLGRTGLTSLCSRACQTVGLSTSSSLSCLSSV